MLPGPVSVTTPAAVVAETWAPDAAKVDGVVPIEHCSVAPVTTWLPTRVSLGRPVRQEPFDRRPNGGYNAIDCGGRAGRAGRGTVDGACDSGTHCYVVSIRLLPPQAHDDHPVIDDRLLIHMLSF
jgi:hypothetical protein